jgi:hypothetical protein
MGLRLAIQRYLLPMHRHLQPPFKNLYYSGAGTVAASSAGSAGGTGIDAADSAVFVLGTGIVAALCGVGNAIILNLFD